MRSALRLVFAAVLIAGCSANHERMYTDLQGLAEVGSPEAQYHLGMFYNNGLGTELNKSEAFKWFSRSAENGDPLGHYKVGCYYAGQAGGVVPVDDQLALKHKLVAANAGYSLAQWDVAVIYYNDGKVEEAIQWWKAAADQGDPQSFYNLYTVYSKRSASTEDREWAYRYLSIIERNSKSRQTSEIEQRLSELRAELSPEQLVASDDWVEAWKSETSDLTLRAQSGLDDTRKVIQSELKR